MLTAARSGIGDGASGEAATHRTLAYAAAAVIVAALTCSARGADAREIEVATTTTLALDVHAVGLELEVTATLRDNVAQGLAYRPVETTTTCVGLGAHVEQLETEANGVARVTILGSEGRCDVVATYPGDRFHDGSQAAATEVLALATPEVSVDAPRTVEGLAWRGILVATAELDGAELTDLGATLSSPCLHVEPHDIADAWVVSPASGSATMCDWTLNLPATSRHAAVSVSGSVRRVRDPQVTAHVDRLRVAPFAAPRWRVGGAVRDADGAVADGRIEVRVDGGAPMSTRTDASGEWTLEVGLDRGASGQHVVDARFVPDLPTDAEGASRRTAFDVPRSAVDQVPMATLITLTVLLVALGVVRLALAWSGRRRSAPRPAGAGVSEHAAPGPAPNAAQDDGTARLVLRDADTGWAIPGRIEITAGDAEIVLTPDADGQAHCQRPGGSGRWSIRATSPGYVTLETSSAPPRAGRALVVRLVSVRSRVRRVLEDLVAELDVGDVLEPRWWGRRTTGEVRDVLARHLRRLRHAPARDPVARRELLRLVATARDRGGRGPAVEAAEALAMFADDVTFGARGWDEGAVGIAEGLAEQVRASLRGDGA